MYTIVNNSICISLSTLVPSYVSDFTNRMELLGWLAFGASLFHYYDSWRRLSEQHKAIIIMFSVWRLLDVLLKDGFDVQLCEVR